jgi:hypothetical protein
MRPEPAYSPEWAGARSARCTGGAPRCPGVGAGETRRGGAWGVAMGRGGGAEAGRGEWVRCVELSDAT